MNNLSKLWAGNVYGTNTGNLFISFDEVHDRVHGTIRLQDDSFGLTIYEVNGMFVDAVLKLKGSPRQQDPGIATGELTVEGKLTPQGTMQGVWSTSIGTAGTFKAHPHDINQSSNGQSQSETVPPQLYSRDVSLGAVRLFKEDVKELIRLVSQDFVSSKVVVTYSIRGSEVTKFAEHFLVDADRLESLRNIKIYIQEHEANGINKLVSIEIKAFGDNRVLVQGIHESWVVGKAETIAAMIKRNERSLVTTYKRFGLNFHQAIFIAMLVAMPSIQEWDKRAIFAGVVVALLALLVWIHTRFLPNAEILLAGKKPSFIDRLWPSWLSWLSAATAAFAASMALEWLVK